ncbi:hypothetical protein [uncultured Thomasclavelia sp.]|uniref:hypothetical protein n=1 Tax=uncultured Thomasclavelia sp. TaxID=3025759 RepID=UPI0025E110D6|nr:hypothetical protein [uncultured Thomasclavelia sp.]
MDCFGLKESFKIALSDIKKLEKLGLLDGVTCQKGQYQFNDEDIRKIVEMIYFLDMGFDEDSLVEYYRNQSNQVNILIKVRNNMLKQLHESQKKLDSVDYLINHK